MSPMLVQEKPKINTGALSRSELIRLHVKYRNNKDIEYAFRNAIRALDRDDEESYVFWLRHCAVMCGHYKPWERAA
jgi:hypothetical protein